MNDGAPNGERVVDGATFPVLDELQLWQPSEIPSLTVQIFAPGPADVEDQCRLFGERDLAAEPAGSLRILCACCSQGRLEQRRTVEAGAQLMWLAAPLETAAELLDRWSAPGRTWAALEKAHLGV